MGSGHEVATDPSVTPPSPPPPLHTAPTPYYTDTASSAMPKVFPPMTHYHENKAHKNRIQLKIFLLLVLIRISFLERLDRVVRIEAD